MRLAVVLEHREVDDPQRAPAVGHELEILAHLQAQRAERIVDDLGLVGAEEHQVAIERAAALENAGDRRIVEKLDDRGLQSLATLGALVDLEIGETAGAVARHVRGVLIDLRARQRAAAGHAQRRHPALRILGGTCKHLEIATGDQVGHIDELERDAQVRLVGAEAAHRLVIAHARKRIGQLLLQHLAEQLAHQRFHQLGDLLLRTGSWSRCRAA